MKGKRILLAFILCVTLVFGLVGCSTDSYTYTLNYANLKMSVGQEEQLSVTVDPVKEIEVSYESSDPAVASVSADGKVSAVANGSAVITGQFSEEEAKGIADALSSGSFPFQIEVDAVFDTDPKLGASNVRNGIWVGVISMILVALFMIVYYRLIGVNKRDIMLLFVPCTSFQELGYSFRGKVHWLPKHRPFGRHVNFYIKGHNQIFHAASFDLILLHQVGGFRDCTPYRRNG